MQLAAFLLLFPGMPLGAEEADVLATYKAVIATAQKDPAGVEKKRDEFLRALGPTEFRRLIVQMSEERKTAKTREGEFLAMTVLAMSYVAGPRQGEPAARVLDEILDPGLPPTWKCGLLDALRVPSRLSVASAEELRDVSGILCRAASQKGQDPTLRRDCLAAWEQIILRQIERLAREDEGLRTAQEGLRRQISELEGRVEGLSWGTPMRSRPEWLRLYAAANVQTWDRLNALARNPGEPKADLARAVLCLWQGFGETMRAQQSAMSEEEWLQRAFRLCPDAALPFAKESPDSASREAAAIESMKRRWTLENVDRSLGRLREEERALVAKQPPEPGDSEILEAVHQQILFLERLREAIVELKAAGPSPSEAEKEEGAPDGREGNP